MYTDLQQKLSRALKDNFMELRQYLSLLRSGFTRNSSQVNLLGILENF